LEQLILADKLKLPVVLHIRDAWDEFFDLYNANKNLFCNGVDVHCFDAGIDVAKKLVDAGFYTSLTARSIENMSKSKDILEYLPLDRLMVETDSPYLLPRDYKDTETLNTPKNVNWVAQHLAEYKGLSLQQVDEITTRNAYALFTKMGEYNEQKRKK